jgi:Holliday junction resolvasome RuvABC endonuclease subunit
MMDDSFRGVVLFFTEEIMNKYVIGLDLSLSSTGICVFSNDGSYRECMTIETAPKEELGKKLKHIADAFLFVEKKYRPEVVVIEKGFTRYNFSTQQLFRVHGIANYIFYKYRQVYIPSASIKKIVGGMGNMKKDEIRDVVLSMFPDVKFKSMDESDAFSICLAYFYMNDIKVKTEDGNA